MSMCDFGMFGLGVVVGTVIGILLIALVNASREDSDDDPDK